VSVRPFLAALLAPVLASTAAAAVPDAEIVLTVDATGLPGQVAAAVPARFVLLGDRSVFVGGTSAFATTRIEGRDVSEIDKMIKRVRRIRGLGPQVAFGPGPGRMHLVVERGGHMELTATGDPASSSPALRPLAALLTYLASYLGPDLRPYRPSAFAVSAREEALPGGCRPWTLPASLKSAVASPQLVAAGAAERWPTGGDPASVCGDDGKTWSVGLRPLLPGERP
jgi:hypothetical protein